jgi:heme A synthase
MIKMLSIKIKKYLLILIGIFYYFSSSVLVGAQRASEDAGGAGLVPCDGPNCDIDHFLELLFNVMNYIIWLGIIFSSLVFVYAGFLYITAQGDSSKVQRATKIFTNVAVGLFLAFIAFLLIEVITTSLGLDTSILPIDIGS